MPNALSCHIEYKFSNIYFAHCAPACQTLKRCHARYIQRGVHRMHPGCKQSSDLLNHLPCTSKVTGLMLKWVSSMWFKPFHDQVNTLCQKSWEFPQGRLTGLHYCDSASMPMPCYLILTSKNFHRHNFEQSSKKLNLKPVSHLH